MLLTTPLPHPPCRTMIGAIRAVAAGGAARDEARLAGPYEKLGDDQ